MLTVRRGVPGSGAGPREEGFTLIELTIALGLLSGAMVGIAYLTLMGVKVSGFVRQRTQATSVTVQLLEEANAAPYDRLGFASTQTGYVDTFVDAGKTYNTVQVTNPALTPVPPSTTLAGVRYDFRRDIYWADASIQQTEAYKKVTVVTTWTAAGVTHTIRQDRIVYPGALGAYSGPKGGTTTTSTTAPIGNPSPPTVVAAANVALPASAVDLSWTPGATPPAVDHWVVQYSTDNFVSSVLTASNSVVSGTTSYTVSTLAASTTYWFRVGAATATGTPQWSTAVSKTTAAGGGSGACAVTSQTLSPTSVSRVAQSNSKLVSNPVVSVTTSGTCSSLQIKYSPLNNSTYVTATMTPPVSPSTHWTATLDGNRNWSTGLHTVQVIDLGTNTPFSGSPSLTVLDCSGNC
jgi:Tfp pilus assembly protein PilV